MENKQIIQTALFNPKIKSYILLVGSFLLLVTLAGIPLLIFWLLGLGQYLSRKYYNALHCQLTTRRLEFKKGAFFKVEKTIPLENIQDITFIENPFLNLFGLKVIKIETAGNSRPSGSDMKLIGIVEPEKFKQKVLDQREILLNSKSSAGSKSNFQISNEDVLLDIKNILLDIQSKM